MKAQFSIDTAALLIEVEKSLKAFDPNAIGLRMGLRELRRHLHQIAVRALELNDRELIEELQLLTLVHDLSDGPPRTLEVE